MSRRLTQLTFRLQALLIATLALGCAQDRPARNGVFNENQYARKDFLLGGVNPDGSPSNPNDPGWFVRATVTETSTPNLMGAAINPGGLWGGLQGPADLVRFRVTEDKLQLLSQIQLSAPDSSGQNSVGVTDSISNAWGITNVDLKYRVNLDGTRSNFYEENQELPWQQRQWVKINFAKNDFSDLAPLGPFTSDFLLRCSDVGESSATLVNNSFRIEGQDTADISDDYLEFSVQIAIPMRFDDSTCLTAYGPQLDNAARLGRTTVTANLKYSFMRAKGMDKVTYTPFPIDEKDPIHRKYGPFLWTAWNRDPQSGQTAATQYVGRFDPKKPIVWYFDRRFPPNYKDFFVNTTNKQFTLDNDDPATIRGATNSILKASGAAARVDFKEYTDQIPVAAASIKTEQDCTTAGLWWDTSTCYSAPPREYGDMRYNFLRWVSDEDMQDSFAGVTMPAFDPRTGEIINEGIEFNDFAIKDYYTQRIDTFLQSIGATPTDPKTGQPVNVNTLGEWPTGACTTGQTQPLVNATLIANHNAQSTLFTKMQQYLNLNSIDPDPNNNHLGPQDFVAKQDQDFLNAYLSIIPYQIYADPGQNQFTTPEGGAGVFGPSGIWQSLQNETQFHAVASKINSGQTPFDDLSGSGGLQNATTFVNTYRNLAQGHMDYRNTLAALRMRGHLHQDAPDAFSLESVIVKDSRHCIDGQWETKEHWEQALISTYWSQVAWHEFGHAMGLEHNFMASVDLANFPDGVKDPVSGSTRYPLYSSSVMEYNSAPDRVFWTPAWGKYDQGAIGWIYANDGRKPADGTKDAASSGALSGQVDAAYPYSDPLGFDMQGKERQFLRCDETHLAYTPLCRQGDLGITPSEIIANALDEYEWQYPWRNFRNYRKVWNDATYADGVLATVYDLNRFLSMWAVDWAPGNITAILQRTGFPMPTDAVSRQNYQGQLGQKFTLEMSKANSVVAAFHEAVIQQTSAQRPLASVYDNFYGDVTQQGITLDKFMAMVNWVGLWPILNYNPNVLGSYIASWDIGDSSFASVAQSAVTSMLGGQYNEFPYFVPTAVSLFAQDSHSPQFYATGNVQPKEWIGGFVFNNQLDFVNYFKTLAVNAGTCTTFDTCKYDVTDDTVTNATPDHVFFGPDGLKYIWTYIRSRDQWVVARADRNPASYNIILNYNVDLFENFDDGTNGAVGLEYPIRYTLDAFKIYE
ncbi:MAG TPA: zinc-dependent metalloprotease [Polyangia bacterium]|jgi:hypothetical protein